MTERDDTPAGSGTTTTRYAQDGWDPALAGATGLSNFNVWADLDGSNDLLTRYFHGDQVDQLFGRQDSLVQYWTLTDRLGSVRDVLDNTGTVKDAINYDGWGNIKTGETDPSYRGNYAWTGRQFDVETDLQYNRARWYDPETGRWQSQDPLGFEPGDSNLYRYVNNRATVPSDPSGLVAVLRAAVRTSGILATMDMETQGRPYTQLAEVDRKKTNTLRGNTSRHISFAGAWTNAGFHSATNKAFKIGKAAIPAGTYLGRYQLIFFQWVSMWRSDAYICTHSLPQRNCDCDRRQEDLHARNRPNERI